MRKLGMPVFGLLFLVVAFFSPDTVLAAGVEYATAIQPLFDSTAPGYGCVGCHKNGTSGSAQLDLTVNNSYNFLVNVVSNTAPPTLRVKPNDAANSRLPAMISTTHKGKTVSATDKNTINTWINQGALPNTNPPTLVSCSPSAGPAGGGQSVTLTGTAFGGNPAATGFPTVTFGGTAATGVTVVNFTTITCTTPAHASGTVDVVVTTANGSATRAGAYAFAPPAPTVTGASPASGPVAGGTSVGLTGTGFTAGATVTFGGAAATGVTVVSATQITCSTPAHAAGAVDVVVTTSGGAGTLGAGFSYRPAPTLVGVTPNSGLPAGGTAVSLSGTNFLAGAGVTFGGAAAAGVTVVSATQITCSTPAHATGAVNVVVTTAGGSATLSNGFTYSTAPTIASIGPNAGPTGGAQAVTINGAGFSAGAGVTFGGTAAGGVTVVSTSQITCTTPAHAAGAVNVVVTTSGGSATSTGGYTYLNAPALASVTPASGPAGGGSAVTLSGTNFTAGAGVTFGGAPASGIVVIGATQITCTTPAHASGPVNVVVTTAGGSGTLANGFTYTNAPTLASLAPLAGPLGGGQLVALTGTNFAAGAGVTFGGAAATGVTVVSATQITCSTPAHAAGVVNVVVTTGAGSATLTGGYTYTPAPSITSISPGGGPLGGGQGVTIDGAHFTTGTTVAFGGAPATGVVVVSAGRLTCVTPAHAAGAVAVTLTAAGGSATLPADYAYYNPPALSGVAPVSGPATGGQDMVLSGVNFISGATVTLGGVAATGATVVSADRITCLTPPHAAGAVDVTVTTAGGTVTLANAYRYLDAPALAGATPGAGPLAGGQSLVLTGTGFVVGATVTFGGTSATGVTVVDAGQITCLTPPHAAGVVDIVVTTAGGAGTLAGGYAYAAAPTLTGVSPNRGSGSGGQSVTLAGTGFLGGAAVTFGGVEAGGVAVASPTQLSCTTPTRANGLVDVVVTTAGGAATLVGGYTFEAPAVVDFATQVQPLFEAGTGYGCVACHTSGGSAGLNLTFGNSYSNLVNVASTTQPPLLRVKPFDAANSLLPQVVGVPHNGKNVTAADLTTLRDWIAQGAPEAAGPPSSITVTSPALASPNPALINRPVEFSVGATSLVGAALTYAWDFGDGVGSAESGLNYGNHSYNVPGKFTATVTISDGQGKSATSSTSVTVFETASGAPPGQVDFASQIQPIFTAACVACHGANGPAGLNLAAGVSFANLVNVPSVTVPGSLRVQPGSAVASVLSQRVEKGHGAISPADTTLIRAWIDQGALAAPAGGGTAGGATRIPMPAGTLNARVAFGKTGRDVLRIKGVLPGLPAGFAPDTLTVDLNVGGVTASFTLDDKGRARSDAGSYRMKLKKVKGAFAGGDAPFRFLLGGTFADAWLDKGVDPQITGSKPADFAVEVDIGGAGYSAVYPVVITTTSLKCVLAAP